MKNALQSKLFWVAVAFIATLFLPWRVIYKGTSVFVVLPLWWEYGNPQTNFMIIVGHIAISLISGIIIALLISFCVKMYKSHNEANT